MALTVTANVPLNRPSLRLLVELDLSPTIRCATEDIYPTGALGGVLFEKRLAEEPVLQLATGSEFGGIQRVEECSCTLSNADGSLNTFFSGEQRGKAARVHIYDKETGELQQNVFSGLISSFDFDLRTVAVSLVNMDFAKLGDVVPASRVTKADFPEVPERAAPSGGRGDIIPYGWGVGKKIPGRYCRAWNGSASSPEYYDYVFGVGNLGIDLLWRYAVAEGDAVLNDPTQYLPLYRTYQVNGRYCTALRFFKHMSTGGVGVGTNQLLPLVADVQRVYPDFDGSVVSEWKWKSTFRDDHGTLHATAGAGSGLTTAALVAGPTGVGLGAVLLDGTNDSLDTPDTTETLAELIAFTLETWVRVDAVTNAIVILGSGSAISGGGTVTDGYGIEYDGAASKFRFRVRTNTGGVHMAETPATITTGRWYYLACVRDANTNTTKLYLDGTLVATTTATGTVAYVAPHKFSFSTSLGGGAWHFPGAIGYTRFSRTARDARYVKRSWWMMRRNGIEFLRDFLELERGYTLDVASFDTFGTATTDWDNVPTAGAGLLKVDGWVTEESTEQAIIEALVPFRDLRVGRSSAGEMQVFVAKLATAVTAQFGAGVGEQFGNVVSVNRRLRASLAEAIKELPIHYRVQRDDNGAFSNFQLTEMKATGLTVGRTGEPLLLPFVYDHVTADIIRSFRGKRIVTRDELIDVTLAHEGRELKPGKIARLTFPPLGIADKDYEVLVANFHRPLVDVTAVPYAETDYTYTAGTVPTDGIITVPLTLDMGTSQLLKLEKFGAIADESAEVRITIELSDKETLTPTGGGTHQESDSVVGVGSRFAAINPADGSGDSGYIVVNPTSGVFKKDTYTFTDPALFNVQRGRRVNFWFRARTTASLPSFGLIRGCVRQGGVTAEYVPLSIQGNQLTTSFAWRTLEVSGNPVTGLAWTAADLLDPTLELGYAVNTTVTVHIAEFYVEFVSINETPTDFGYSAVWHQVDPLGPWSYAEPYADGPRTGLVLSHRPTTSGMHYYSARLFDGVGRMAPIAVDGSVNYS